MISLAIDPNTSLDDTGFVCVDAFTVLLSVKPLAIILLVVGPYENTSTFLFIIDVVTRVGSAIFPSEHTSTVHFAVSPGAFIASAIVPPMLARALHKIVEEVSEVSSTVSPLEFTLAGFGTFFESALKNISVRVALNTLTILKVIFPVSDVLYACLVSKSTLAVCFVINEVTVVHFTVGVDKTTFAVGLVVLPVAFVVLTIDPGHLTCSLLLAGPRYRALVSGLIVGLNADLDFLLVDNNALTVIEGIHTSLDGSDCAACLSDLIDGEVRSNL